MEARPSGSTWTHASALAIIVAAADVHRFAPALWLHDRALFELSQLAIRGGLRRDISVWRFTPSPNGGYALVGLGEALLILSEEGWLRRDSIEAAYVVSAEFRDWGSRELAALSAKEVRGVRQVARRWKARASVSSKNAA